MTFCKRLYDEWLKFGYVILHNIFIMRNLGILKVIGVLCIVFSIYSCGEETKTLDNAEFGYQYFPVDIGNYRLFRVDSTIVDNNGATILESRTFIKEEITESFKSASGETVFRIERSKSESREGTYVITDVWTAQRNEQVAIRTEENLRFNKLIFPIVINNEWEGNTFENLTDVIIAGDRIEVYKDWGDYEVVADGIDLDVFGITYSDVVTVKQADHDFLLERRSSYEYFAPNIGLIKKEMEIFDTQCQTCESQAWLDKADRGFKLTQILIEHN